MLALQSLSRLGQAFLAMWVFPDNTEKGRGPLLPWYPNYYRQTLSLRFLACKGSREPKSTKTLEMLEIALRNARSPLKC